MNIVTEINWVDILIIAILIRTVIIGLKTGFLVELFKLLGTVAAIYLALHYYISFSDYLLDTFNFGYVPAPFLDFVFFSLLAAIGYLSFFIFRLCLTHFFKAEAEPKVHKWGGCALGVVRGLLAASLFMYMGVISSTMYLKESVYGSYLGSRVLKIAPATYRGMWYPFMSKFVSDEKYNEEVSQVEQAPAK